jgi:hypothetical protein
MIGVTQLNVTLSYLYSVSGAESEPREIFDMSIFSGAEKRTKRDIHPHQRIALSNMSFLLAQMKELKKTST